MSWTVSSANSGTVARTARAEVSSEASARGRSSRSRGHQAERDFANWLRTVGWPDAKRSVATGWRTQTRRSADEGDIAGTPGLVFQVKYYDGGLTDGQVLAVLIDTEQQREAAAQRFGLLVVRRAFKKPADWHVYVDANTAAVLLNGPWATVPAVGHHFPVQLLAQDAVRLLRRHGFGKD